MISRVWHAWVDFWDAVEPPTALVLVRVLLGLALLYDQVQIARLGLVPWLFAPFEAGGLGHSVEAPSMWMWSIFPATSTTVYALHALLLTSLLTLSLGFFTRTSAVLSFLLLAQQAAVLPVTDRGIDTLARNTLLLLAFGASGAAWSLDAWRKTGDVRGPRRATIPAWPRRLLVVQLVVVYTVAGLAKLGARWWPTGGWSALWVILQDDAVTRFAPPPPAWFWPLSRLGTAGTVPWELCAPLLLCVLVGRHLGDRAPRAISWLVRHQVDALWVSIGVIFHVGIAVMLDLGIFPYAMLALYPAFLHRQAPTDRAAPAQEP